MSGRVSSNHRILLGEKNDEVEKKAIYKSMQLSLKGSQGYHRFDLKQHKSLQ